jgi:hypothetical protein
MPRNYNLVHIFSMERTNHEGSHYVNFTCYFLSWLIAYLRALMRRSAAARLLGSRVRIAPGAWMDVVNVVCGTGRGLGRAHHSSRGVLLNVCH